MFKVTQESQSAIGGHEKGVLLRIRAREKFRKKERVGREGVGRIRAWKKKRSSSEKKGRKLRGWPKQPGMSASTKKRSMEKNWAGRSVCHLRGKKEESCSGASKIPGAKEREAQGSEGS